MKNETLTYRVGKLEKECEKMDLKLSQLMTNDLPHIQSAMQTIQTDVDWLKRSYWLIAGASVGALFTGVIGLLQG